MDETTEKKFEELMEMIMDNNNSDFNALKLVEECTELNELLIKSVLQKHKMGDSKARIIEELGDVLMRLTIYAIGEGLEEDVERRVNEKLLRLHERFKEGGYGLKIHVEKP